jgi:CHAD domain-containing protein
MARDSGEDQAVRPSPSTAAVTERPALAPLPAELALPEIRGPISPELVLVDPELGRAARAALPEHPWPQPTALPERARPSRRVETGPRSRYDSDDELLRELGITLERDGDRWRLSLPRGEVVEASGDEVPPSPIAELLGTVLVDRQLLPIPERSSDPDVARLQEMIWSERLAILAHDPGTRLGIDPENLHQLRVATRRIRAFLRVARSHVEAEWADETRRQLGELGRSLGPVRDLDVLLETLRPEVSGLDDAERPAAEKLLAQLQESRDRLHDELVQALDAPAYAEIVDRLLEPIHPAAEPPRRTLAKLAEREIRRLAKRVDRLGASPADEALHRLRIRVKRVRYTLELASPDADKRTERMIRAAKRLQDVLGEHQDAVVAEERIRTLAAESEAGEAFVAGRLAERQAERRRQLRKRFPRAWRRLRRASRRL